MASHPLRAFGIRALVFLLIAAAPFVQSMEGATPGGIDSSFDPAPGTDDTVTAIALQSDGKAIAVGRFTHVNGVVRNRIARFNPNGSLDTTFDPGFGADGDVNAVVVQTDGRIVIAGQFLRVDGFTRNRIARLNTDGSVDQSFDPGSGINNVARAVAIDGIGRILVGGQFGQAGGALRNNIARFYSDGPIDLSFNPGIGANGEVLSIRAQSDGRIYLGGLFTTYDGSARGGVVRINSDGSRDDTYLPANASGNVTFIVPGADGRLIIGGRFTQVAGRNRTYLARLNFDGTVDETFAPQPDNYVSAAAVQPDGKIIVGGRFTAINGYVRNRIARLFPDGTIDLSFDPGEGFSGSLTSDATEVQAIRLLTDGRAYAAGVFTGFGGFSRFNIARVGAGPYELLLNVSTRAHVLTDDRVLIAGFIVNGIENKRVLLRGIGPSLTAFGVAGALLDPTLELRDNAGTLIATNDNWRSTQAAEIAATGSAPSNDAEAAIVITLPPGVYTATLRGANNSTGVALAEVLDIDPRADSQISNLSTRSFVGIDDEVMIAGLIAGPSTDGNVHTLIRALGPSLAGFGIGSPLQNPTLELHNGSGMIVATNDDWAQTQSAQIAATGLAPSNARESAIRIDLAPGAYTAIVRGKNNTTGVGLVEAYRVP